MDYSAVIELDNITLEDCIDLYEKKGIATVINNGKIENFIEEK